MCKVQPVADTTWPACGTSVYVAQVIPVSGKTLFFRAVKLISLWFRSVLALGHMFFTHLSYSKDL